MITAHTNLLGPTTGCRPFYYSVWARVTFNPNIKVARAPAKKDPQLNP